MVGNAKICFLGSNSNQLNSKWAPSGGLQVDSNWIPLGLRLRPSQIATRVQSECLLESNLGWPEGLESASSAAGGSQRVAGGGKRVLKISSAAGGGPKEPENILGCWRWSEGSSAAVDGLRSVENILSCWRWPEGVVRGCPQLLAADRRGWAQDWRWPERPAWPSPAQPSPGSTLRQFCCSPEPAR